VFREECHINRPSFRGAPHSRYSNSTTGLVYGGQVRIIWEDQDAHTILWTWFGGPAAPGPDETWNERVPFGYYDAEAAHLLEVIYATPDPEVRDTLYARFNEILRRDMPVMILFPGVYHYAAHRRIRGFRQGRGWLNHPHELWLDPD